MFAGMTNAGAYAFSARVTGNNTATAAGTGDNTLVAGAWVDRTNVRSAKLIINYTTTLAQGATLQFAIDIQDATTGSGTGAAVYGSAVSATTVSTGGTGGSTNTGTVEVDIDLSGARQFIRARITPDLSAGGTDTAAWSATFVLFGASRQPSSLKLANIGPTA